MLRNNLSMLLTERQLRISKLANDTGISRTTLTSLSTNSSKMVQIDTVNRLCQALKIQPADFFEYVPFDFEYTFDEGEPSPDNAENSIPTFDSMLFINVTENNSRVDTIELQGFTEYYNFNGASGSGTLMTGTGLYPSNTEQLDKLDSYLKQMSVAFISDLKKEIANVIEDSLTSGSENKVDASCEINFDETFEQYQAKLKNRNTNSSPADSE